MWLSCITNFQGGLASRKMTAVIGWKNHHPTILHKPSFLLSLSTNFGAFSLIRSSWQPQPSQPVQPVRSEQVNRCQWQKTPLLCNFCRKTKFQPGYTLFRPGYLRCLLAFAPASLPASSPTTYAGGSPNRHKLPCGSQSPALLSVSCFLRSTALNSLFPKLFLTTHLPIALFFAPTHPPTHARTHIHTLGTLALELCWCCSVPGLFLAVERVTWLF